MSMVGLESCAPISNGSTDDHSCDSEQEQRSGTTAAEHQRPPIPKSRKNEKSRLR